MDPTRALDDLRTAVSDLRALLTDEVPTETWHVMNRVVQGFEDIDTWLSNGGWAPGPWGPPVEAIRAVQRELNAHPTWTTPSQTTDELQL